MLDFHKNKKKKEEAAAAAALITEIVGHRSARERTDSPKTVPISVEKSQSNVWQIVSAHSSPAV